MNKKNKKITIFFISLLLIGNFSYIKKLEKNCNSQKLKLYQEVEEKETTINLQKMTIKELQKKLNSPPLETQKEVKEEAEATEAKKTHLKNSEKKITEKKEDEKNIFITEVKEEKQEEKAEKQRQKKQRKEKNTKKAKTKKQKNQKNYTPENSIINKKDIEYIKSLDINKLDKILKGEVKKGIISTQYKNDFLDYLVELKHKSQSNLNFKTGNDFNNYNDMIKYYKTLDRKYLYNNLSKLVKNGSLTVREYEQILEDVEN